MTDVRRDDLACVVQAGGLSSRMGFDKATASFLGEPLVQRVLERIAPVASELLVTSVRPRVLSFLEQEPVGGLEVRVCRDLQGAPGAMRGIASSLDAASRPLVAIVACDMPFVSADLIGALADRVLRDGLDACVPRTSRGLEPLCAVWRRESCLPVARELLAEDSQRIRFLINRLETGFLDEDEDVAVAGSLVCFENVNTPREFARAEAFARGVLVPDGALASTGPVAH